MKFLNFIVEGTTEESFVNEVLVKHFASINIFVSVRKIRTGWNKSSNKPAKGGLLNYLQLRNDVLRWIQSDRNNPESWFTTMLDLYGFPKDEDSPYTSEIQSMTDPYQRIVSLEMAFAQDIHHPRFIPYIQLHEFEAFLFIDPDRLITMYPDTQDSINRLKKELGNRNPEEINESPHTAPSKRIRRFLPDYEGQKAQVGPLIAGDIGIKTLRAHCPHFNDWIFQLENI